MVLVVTIANGYFDEIHFTESNIKDFEFVDKDIIINIMSGLEIYSNHLLSSTYQSGEPCKLIFKNVSFSKQIIYDYADCLNKNKFKDKKEVVHQLDYYPNDNVKSEDYFVEGVLQNPQAWLSWDIVAEEFYLDDLKS